MVIPSVEIFAVIRDEEKFLEFFYNFYKRRLTNVSFSLLDMGSVDQTLEIAKRLGINVDSQFEEHFSDSTNMQYKNECWKNSKADYVIIQDLDELLDIDDDFLMTHRFSAIQAEAWDMIGEGQPLPDITKAVRLAPYDKIMMFKVSDFQEINFKPGAHRCAPKYKVSKPIFLRRPMYHYNRLSVDYTLDKYARRRQRLSQENLEKKWGFQYLFSEEDIRNEHQKLLNKAIHVLPTKTTLSPDYNPLESVITYYRKHFGALARYIIDIGSRDGDDARYLKRALNGQYVIAVEADPLMASQIRKNHPDFTVWAIGVSDKHGLSTFQRVISNNKEFRGSSSLKSYEVEKNYKFEVIHIPVTTIEELLHSNSLSDQILDVVKIDCEGFTYQVLQGFGDQIKNVKLFHLETEQNSTHPEHVGTQGIAKFMHEKGFRLLEISSEWGHGIIDQIWVNYDLVLYQKSLIPAGDSKGE